ncbi:hypothetical protein Y032_0006g3140 [Ancylostoma ceylanicum]|nr:hypothetical protein Y032_0006g3140 [Ancylostoma ceylanicum]
MWLLFLCLAFHEILGDSYTEELRVRRLASGNLLTEFRLNITSDDIELGPRHILFPRIIAEIISTHSVAELSFHLTQGRWYSSRWGLPPQPSGSTGAMVHAWIYGNETT